MIDAKNILEGGTELTSSCWARGIYVSGHKPHKSVFQENSK